MATTTTSSNIIGDTSSGRPLDIIIFGATGFTGTATVHEAVKLLTDTGTGLRFGIAGRNARKLRDVLATVGERVGRDLSASVPIVLADVADEGSLQRMAEQTKVKKIMMMMQRFTCTIQGGSSNLTLIILQTLKYQKLKGIKG